MRPIHTAKTFLSRLTSGPPLTAVRAVRKMRGGSQSCLIECSDGAYYIVKMLHNPQGPNLLANEMLGNVFSHALALPVPSAAPVILSASFVTKFSHLLSFETQHGAYTPAPGLHFASGLLRPAAGSLAEYLGRVTLPHLIDAPSALTMFILDVVACTRDRRQALFLKEQDSRRVDMTFIDNGGMFGGPHWRFDGIPSNHYPQIDISQYLCDQKRVARCISGVQRILPTVIAATLPLVPANWAAGDMRSLESNLLDRLNRLADLTASYPFMQRASEGSQASYSGSVVLTFT